MLSRHAAKSTHGRAENPARPPQPRTSSVDEISRMHSQSAPRSCPSGSVSDQEPPESAPSSRSTASGLGCGHQKRNRVRFMVSSLRQRAQNLRRLWRLPTSVQSMHAFVQSMHDGTLGRLDALADGLQSVHNAASERLSELAGAWQSAREATSEHLAEVDRTAQQSRRDILERLEQMEPLVHAALGLQRARLRERYGQLEIITDHPVALDLPDHQVPWGTANDNSRNQRSDARLLTLIPGQGLSSSTSAAPAAGGTQFHRTGLSRGRTGGQRSFRATLVREWATISDLLFTADITEPFRLRTPRSADAQRFGIVTMWEVIEHTRNRSAPGAVEFDAHLHPGES